MYCGGKKYSPTSSPSSIINRVLQISWFPKSKRKSQHRDKPDFPIPTTPLPSFRTDEKFYSVDDDDDDAYWRFSFRDQKSITEGTSLRYDPDDTFQIPVSSFIGFGGVEEMDAPSRNSRPVERDIFPVEKVQIEKGCQVSPVSTDSEEQQNIYLRNSSSNSSDEDYVASGRMSISEWQNLEKANDATELKRRSPCRKINRKNRANNYSPKREFRVRALEDLKKERMRSKTKKKETKDYYNHECTTIYDSFAEVKDSFDPQQDFRDSMVEMICVKRITRPDELEDLLACYLTLNSDEYHDLIIKVFQRVWFELRWGVC